MCSGVTKGTFRKGFISKKICSHKAEQNFQKKILFVNLLINIVYYVYTLTFIYTFIYPIKQVMFLLFFFL